MAPKSVLPLTLLYAEQLLASPTPRCKSVPGSASWPSPSQWASLNSTLSGRLIAPKPPAIVCDSTYPSTYNKPACDALNETVWFSEEFYETDPVSAHYPNWQGDACLPTSVYNGTEGCDTSHFPYYVVNATCAEDVSAAIKFAAETGVRLSVKGTGHDFLGRSAAPGLMVWTHYIRGIDIIPSFTPNASSREGSPAVKIAAGHVWGEVYDVCKKQKLIPVGGADATVGLGGYLLGGGHSPISAKYGLAADSALEMEVVTPCGNVVVANECQNEDLFWALKGGGGSTFGILLSATVRAYPTFKIQPFSLIFSSLAKDTNSDNFYSALATLHTQLPPLSDANITGYWGFGPSNATDPTSPMTFGWEGWMLDGDEASLKKLVQPLSDAINSTKGLNSSLEIQPESDIYDVVGGGGGGSSSSSSSDSSGSSGSSATPEAGFNLVIGSRLWDKKALSNSTALAAAFRALSPGTVSGLFVSGPGVRNPALAGSASFTPAWRDTYLHVFTGNTWPYENSTAGEKAIHRNTYVTTAALRDVAPDTGAYLNEADVNEPNFQQAFWGSNYKRLLEIKKKYDPQTVFWCKSCVGSEGWEAKENGEVCPVG